MYKDKKKGSHISSVFTLNTLKNRRDFLDAPSQEERFYLSTQRKKPSDVNISDTRSLYGD